MAAQFFNRIGQMGLGVAVLGGVVNSALYNVEGGHRAVIFDRFTGIKENVVGEGTHFFIPWVQRPIIFDIRSQPRNVPVITGSKDLQNVNITLRILYRPIPDQLPKIYTILGQDYDERVLPSIAPEVLKAVVAQFDAGELITQREVGSTREDSFVVGWQKPGFLEQSNWLYNLHNFQYYQLIRIGTLRYRFPLLCRSIGTLRYRFPLLCRRICIYIYPAYSEIVP